MAFEEHPMHECMIERNSIKDSNLSSLTSLSRAHTLKFNPFELVCTFLVNGYLVGIYLVWLGLLLWLFVTYMSGVLAYGLLLLILVPSLGWLILSSCALQFIGVLHSSY